MAYSQMGEGYLWVYPTINEQFFETLVKEYKVHPITSQILINRGYNNWGDIQKFLYAKLPDLLDPYLFMDMDHAVDRVCKAIDENQNILIYGDNDVDGMTGTSLLTDFLKSLGAHVFFYVPNRNMLKQSVILDAMNYALINNCKLLITVDCSITATDDIEEMVKDKVDIIITDHHEPTLKLPHCIATLNPKIVNSTYPNREITGVGVAFKLAHGITNHRIATKQLDPKEINLKRYLDLVALGTIADMGALFGENRIFVRYGLEQLRDTKRIGLKKLFSICEINPHTISSTDIASKVAPRLNSLGRIADPRRGVEFLLIEDEVTAEVMAKELDLNNIERQKIEKVMSEEIDEYISKNSALLENKAIVLYSSDWHPGIIPIITARIAKLYSRPTVLIAIDDGIGKASMRTIPEFPLLPFLKKHAELYINFGGHNAAAGLTIKEEFIETFKERFISFANQNLHIQDVQPKLFLDAPANFSDLTFDLMETLGLLEPYGNENPAPILYCDTQQAWPPKVINNMHLKLFLEQGDRFLEGIAVNMANRRHPLYQKGLKLRIAFTPQVSYYQSKASIQLIIKDFQILE